MRLIDYNINNIWEGFNEIVGCIFLKIWFEIIMFGIFYIIYKCILSKV